MTRLLTVLMLAFIAAGCKRDEAIYEGKSLSHWKKEATQVSWMSFWNSEKDERRSAAFRQLSSIGEPAVPVLVDLLKHSSVSVRGDAFNALTNLGPRAAAAAPEMMKLLDGDDPELRRRAVWILGTIGPSAEPAVPALTRLLGDPDPRLRDVAARALAQIGGSGYEALDRAGTSRDVNQRAAAMRGASERALDVASRRNVLSAGLSDPSPEVRMLAVELLNGAEPADAESLASYLVSALHDSSEQVRSRAQTVLTRYLQRGGVRPRLLAAVLEGGDDASRANAAWYLGHAAMDRRSTGAAFDDPEVFRALITALRDDDSKIRLYAARALANTEGRPRQLGIEELERLADDSTPEVRNLAKKILSEVRSAGTS